ncbi:D-alanine--D-alanine ligase family protein [Eubacterium oxidoreducens]|uniref:D-alanine--D-alanine ligase n=1 Tax=Eubacterium oxidoreducens TaxID=1732 RepID=A0A1G6CKR5_EUBOX|nr:D-alanine--D-alanine ligase [Eubacterium oxidoreducens]SDB33450.1 D-alanine-D-alanine ligase [Eubacterium oxidoreducens]
MNIVVLAGGLSTERDVSLISGTNIAKALRRNGHNALLLDVFLGIQATEEELEHIFEKSEEVSADAGKIKEQSPDIRAVRQMRSQDDGGDGFFGPNVLSLCKRADLVFMGLHGEDGENGKIQACFDLLEIPYTGSGYMACALAMDKGLTKTLLMTAEIPTPMGITISDKQKYVDVKYTGIDLPCVVKPCCGGSSVGVSIAHTKEEFDAALAQAFKYEDEVVVEQYIKGREFSVAVIDGEALPVIEIAPKEGFYNYENKYQAGAAVETCPADLPDNIAHQMQSYAKEVATGLGLNTYARMDFLLDEQNEMYCLEANTLPGMTPTSLMPQEAKAVGVDFDQLCENIIQVSLKKYTD